MKAVSADGSVEDDVVSEAEVVRGLESSWHLGPTPGLRQVVFCNDGRIVFRESDGLRSSDGWMLGVPQPMNQFTDPNNTTVFVGGPWNPRAEAVASLSEFVVEVKCDSTKSQSAILCSAMLPKWP